MTRTHRTLNRLVLVLVALALFAIAAIAALPLLPASWRVVDVRGVAAALDSRTGLIGVVAVAVVLVVIAIAWIASRGRGRTRDVLGGGELAVDDGVVEGLLGAALEDQPSVRGVQVHAYRHRRRVVYARLQIRRSSDLTVLLDDIDRATARVADELGARPPLVVHLTSGVVARATRARIAR